MKRGFMKNNLLNIFSGEVKAESQLEPIKIPNRNVQCPKCDKKFQSDLARIYKSIIKSRVLCICECGNSFTIKEVLTIRSEECADNDRPRKERKSTKNTVNTELLDKDYL
jgi:hypothetical protein